MRLWQQFYPTGIPLEVFWSIFGLHCVCILICMLDFVVVFFYEGTSFVRLVLGGLSNGYCCLNNKTTRGQTKTILTKVRFFYDATTWNVTVQIRFQTTHTDKPNTDFGGFWEPYFCRKHSLWTRTLRQQQQWIHGTGMILYLLICVDCQTHFHVRIVLIWWILMF